MSRLRNQIFRQIVQIFRRFADASQEISVQDDGIICKQDTCAYLCGIASSFVLNGAMRLVDYWNFRSPRQIIQNTTDGSSDSPMG